MNRDDRGRVQTAIDFLISLDLAAWPSLAASHDYAPLLDLARERGVTTDQDSLQDAFAMIMRVRLLQSGVS